MSRIAIVMKRDYRELRQSNAFRIMLFISVAIVVAAALVISILLSRQPWIGLPEAGPLRELFIGLVLYFLPLLIIMAFIWAFASLPVTREKVNGNLEALMATPLAPRELWLGKSLAVFMPGYLIAVAASFIVVLAINLFVIVPATGGFALPVPALLLGLVVNPLLLLALLLFMMLLSLVNNPDMAMAPSFILGFGLMMGMPIGMGMGAFDISTWSFTLWYLLGTVVLAVAGLSFARLLGRQNIVLSSRGG